MCYAITDMSQAVLFHPASTSCTLVLSEQQEDAILPRTIDLKNISLFCYSWEETFSKEPFVAADERLQQETIKRFEFVEEQRERYCVYKKPRAETNIAIPYLTYSFY